jgi:hypothetical protein
MQLVVSKCEDSWKAFVTYEYFIENNGAMPILKTIRASSSIYSMERHSASS